MIPDDQKRKIIKTLEQRGATQPCPRCGTTEFSLIDGYFIHPINPEVGTVILAGPSVPSVVLVCNRCGFLSQHALGTLGLMPKAGAEKDG